MIKKYVEKISFIMLNIILSSGLLQAIILLILSMFLGAKKYVFASYPDDDIGVVLGVFLFLMPIIWVIKLSIFKIMYKFENLRFIHNLLNMFLLDKQMRKKIIICSLTFDLLILVLPYLLMTLLNWKLFDFGNLKEYLIVVTIITILMGGGVFVSYLSFLLFTKKDSNITTN